MMVTKFEHRSQFCFRNATQTSPKLIASATRHAPGRPARPHHESGSAEQLLAASGPCTKGINMQLAPDAPPPSASNLHHCQDTGSARQPADQCRPCSTLVHTAPCAGDGPKCSSAAAGCLHGPARCSAHNRGGHAPYRPQQAHAQVLTQTLLNLLMHRAELLQVLQRQNIPGWGH